MPDLASPPALAPPGDNPAATPGDSPAQEPPREGWESPLGGLGGGMDRAGAEQLLPERLSDRGHAAGLGTAGFVPPSSGKSRTLLNQFD